MDRLYKILIVVLILTFSIGLTLLYFTREVNPSFIKDKAKFISSMNLTGYKFIYENGKDELDNRSTNESVVKAKKKISQILILTDSLERQFNLLDDKIADVKLSALRIKKIKQMLMSINEISDKNNDRAFNQIEENPIRSKTLVVRKLETATFEYKASGLVLSSLDSLFKITFTLHHPYF